MRISAQAMSVKGTMLLSTPITANANHACKPVGNERPFARSTTSSANDANSSRTNTVTGGAMASAKMR